ncbi:hypothetical protein [Bradyrhizobium guangzhouense]|uniref:hypothetical protein n=1 Tax=Bradyrhizobium guangzhouense TaxID=1325095 RepID=UPI0013E8B3CA|nr:hypothetical protein [Bradyrhizobium guangzhouense]
MIGYISDFIGDIDPHTSAAHSVTPHRSSSPRDPPPWPTFRRAHGIKGTAVTVDFAEAVFGGGFARAGDARLSAGV